MIDAGASHRLLWLKERIQDTDEWCGDGTGDAWHPARPDDVGLAHHEAQHNSTMTHGPVYRRRMTMRMMCGCRQHEIDGGSDPYEQHNAWAEDQQGGDL